MRFQLQVVGIFVDIALDFGMIVIFAWETQPLDDLPKLSHEKLQVYQMSIQFFAISANIWTGFPRGYAELVDQWKRAALSVPLNIAEASGRTGSLDNAKHFSIARGSTLECGAILDACNALNLIEKKFILNQKDLFFQKFQFCQSFA